MSIGKGNKNRKLDSCDNKDQNDGIQWIMDQVEHYLHRRQKHCHDYEGHAPALPGRRGQPITAALNPEPRFSLLSHHKRSCNELSRNDASGRAYMMMDGILSL